MNTSSEKIDIIQWIVGLNDIDTIKELKKFKNKFTLNQNDWQHSISKEESESILRGLDDMDNGKTIEHEAVKKIYEKWL